MVFSGGVIHHGLCRQDDSHPTIPICRLHLRWGAMTDTLHEKSEENVNSIEIPENYPCTAHKHKTPPKFERRAYRNHINRDSLPLWIIKEQTILRRKPCIY